MHICYERLIYTYAAVKKVGPGILGGIFKRPQPFFELALPINISHHIIRLSAITASDGDRGGGRGGRGGRDGGRGGHGGREGIAGGARVTIEPHHHKGIFITRAGKDDALVTLNSTPGVAVYGETRITIDGPPVPDGVTSTELNTVFGIRSNPRVSTHCEPEVHLGEKTSEIEIILAVRTEFLFGVIFD